jgi:hypothetical protein
MVRIHFQDRFIGTLLALAFATLLTGCAGVREQTIGPEYPGEFSQLYNSPCGWSYNPYYAYGRPDYCDPFLGEPFRSHYYFIHDPYWYYYNAYYYPYYPYFPYYYYPYYGHYYDQDDDGHHHHKRGFWSGLKHRADDRKNARDNRVNEWQEKSKDAWDEIQDAIHDRRDARMEQWQGIRDTAQDRREERSERWENFFNNARSAFSRIGEQRQERRENRQDFFKERGLLRDNNHQPLFNRSDNNTGSGNGLFNGGILRGWGGRR